MKKILIVDNDATTLSHLSDAFKEYREFGIYTAKSAKQAAGLIKYLGIDLVLTELDLPDVNGFQLLNFLKTKHPEIPTMAMSHLYSDTAKLKLSQLGVKKWMRKPIHIETLTETFFNELNMVAAGRIHGISLASFLQLVDLENKSCTLTVRTRYKTGVIYCLNGEVIGAETSELKGKDALYKILFWKDASIEIQEACLNVNRQIHIPLMHLLMESHHLNDEENDKESDEGMTSPPPDAEEKQITAPLIDMKRVEAEALSRKLSAIADIEAFVIFDENEVIQAKNKDFFNGVHFLPSFFFKLGNQLDGVGGLLKCADINVNGSSRLALLQYGPLFVVADLKPGCRATACLAKLDA